MVLQIGGVTTGAEDYISAVSGGGSNQFSIGLGSIIGDRCGEVQAPAGLFYPETRRSLSRRDPICGYLTAICYQTDPEYGRKKERCPYIEAGLMGATTTISASRCYWIQSTAPLERRMLVINKPQ